jgi:hypothetical protein
MEDHMRRISEKLQFVLKARDFLYTKSRRAPKSEPVHDQNGRNVHTAQVLGGSIPLF